MRCRKARSFLSAYSNEELSARKAQAVSEHIASCADCRHEEAFYRSLKESGKSMSGLRVSSDFNSQLLNRIAQERFAETRAKAYLPRKAPATVWGKLAPAVVAASLVLIVSVVSMQPFGSDPGTTTAAPAPGIDDSYLTVQPSSNPNMAPALHKNWSLTSQLARADRVSQISNSLTPTESFGSSEGLRAVSAVSTETDRVPFASNFRQFRRVIKVYVTPTQPDNREEEKTY